MWHRSGFHNGEPVKNQHGRPVRTAAKLWASDASALRLPYPHVDDVILLMAEGKILPYLDIPLQHASPRILKYETPAQVDCQLARIKQWREICHFWTPVRLSSLASPVKPKKTSDAARLPERPVWTAVGCFKYSPVEGATNELADQVPEEVKKSAGTASCSCNSRSSRNVCRRK